MNKSVIFLLIFLLLALPCQAEQNWEKTAKKVIDLSRQMDERSLSSKRFTNQDRTALEKRMAALKKSIAQNTKSLEQATLRLNQTSQKRADLAHQYQSETADMKIVEGSFRTALHKSLSRLDQSPFAAMHPEKRQVVKKLLEQNSFPGLKEMQAYTSVLFADIKATGQIENNLGKVIGLNGQVTEVSLYRAGGFFLGFQDSTGPCFVLPQAGRPGLSIKAPGSLGRQIHAWLDDGSVNLPLDITGGTAIRAAEQKKDIGSWIEAGGVLLYPILISGVVGAVFSLLKAMHLLMQQRLGQRKKQQLLDQVKTLDQLQSMLSKIKRCPAARVMEASLSFQGRSIDCLDSIVEEKIMVEQGKQERFLSIIGVLASIAPLLGLLGTVTGMIGTFQAITIFGTGDPRMMSTGISEALVTTQAGLGIAIPLLLAHHFLKRRAALLVEEMETCGMGMIARLLAE